MRTYTADEYDEAVKRAYDDGFDDGYNEGFDAGDAYGYELGVEAVRLAQGDTDG